MDLNVVKYADIQLPFVLQYVTISCIKSNYKVLFSSYTLGTVYELLVEKPEQEKVKSPDKSNYATMMSRI